MARRSWPFQQISGLRGLFDAQQTNEQLQAFSEREAREHKELDAQIQRFDIEAAKRGNPRKPSFG